MGRNPYRFATVLLAGGTSNAAEGTGLHETETETETETDQYNLL